MSKWMSDRASEWVYVCVCEWEAVTKLSEYKKRKKERIDRDKDSEVL